MGRVLKTLDNHLSRLWNRLLNHASSKEWSLTRLSSPQCFPSDYEPKSSWNSWVLTLPSLRSAPKPWQTCSDGDATDPSAAGQFHWFATDCWVWSLPMICLTSVRRTLSYPPQSSVCHCLQSVFPSVLTINSSMNWSVCFPTLALRISPLDDAWVIPIQQSPTIISSGRHRFCFFGQMTRTHHRLFVLCLPAVRGRYEPFVLFQKPNGLNWPQCCMPAW